MADTHLGRLREQVEHFDRRKERASTRLADYPSGAWRFALAGLSVVPPTGASLGEFGELLPVQEPPGEIELASGLNDRQAFSAIGRHMRGVTFELALPPEYEELSLALELGWTIIAGLRLKSGCEFIVPAVANHSWGTIAAADEASVHAQLLEDYPRARRASQVSEAAVSTEDCRWVSENLVGLLKLRADQEFHFALECLSESYVQESWRLAATVLWAGIEALVQVSAEVTYRLSLSVAALLEQPGPERLATFKMVKKLYGMRSRAVHGAHVAEDDLRKHVLLARSILERCLQEIVEIGKVPSVADLEALLMGVTLPVGEPIATSD